MLKPSLLNDIDKYQILPQDFQQPLDRYTFSAIYNLYAGGAEKIHAVDIETYLNHNEVAKDLIEKENGITFFQDCETYSDPNNFNYYYTRLKKFSLLRDLQKDGKNINKFYCEDPLNPDYQKINERFEEMTPRDIVNILKGEVAVLEDKYSTQTEIEEGYLADGLRELIENLKKKPEVGFPLQGEIFNTVTRGARKGTLYLRSGATGVGKSRSMVGDACSMVFPIRYEPKYGKWISTGTPEKILYVITEQNKNEIQTMMLAYLTGINEDVFKYGTFTDEHIERINKAIEIAEQYRDYFMYTHIADPCASVITNLFRRYNFQKNVEYFFYDYVFSSPAMLTEYRDLKLREDVVLRMFTTNLKNLAIELNAFVMTATQLSNIDDEKNKGGFKDTTNIRGSRAIVDLCDFACIMSRPSIEELKIISGFQKRYNFEPNLVTDIFKNRGGRWTMIRIWSLMDLGTCKRYDLFVTTPNNEPIEEFQIVEFNFEKTPEMLELEKRYNSNIDFSEEDNTDKLISMINLETGEVVEKKIDAIKEAFGNDEQTKERLKNVSLGDML